MNICVVGAGIVGLSSAWHLYKAGHSVTVVDEASFAGSGASMANGAQLSYSYVQPLADPALLLHIPSMLLSRDGPLKFSPQWDVQQWRWCIAFLAACRAKVSHQTTIELLQLAQESREAFDTFMGEQNVNCDFARTGKLVLYPDAKGAHRAYRHMRSHTLLALNQRCLDPDEVVHIEPALAGYRADFHRAIYTESECVVDGHKLCLELTRLLSEKGVRFIFGHRVEDFRHQQRRITGVNTYRDDGTAYTVDTQAVVLAAGAYSARLLAKLNVHIPVYPLKGYSITLPVTEENRAPRISVTDMRRKTVFARVGSHLRVAGMIEMCGMDTSLSKTRFSQLIASTEALFAGKWDTREYFGWSGLRPATPTGRPVLAIKGFDNLIINTGQGALGMTLAFGSAKRLVRMIEDDVMPG